MGDPGTWAVIVLLFVVVASVGMLIAFRNDPAFVAGIADMIAGYAPESQIAATLYARAHRLYVNQHPSADPAELPDAPPVKSHSQAQERDLRMPAPSAGSGVLASGEGTSAWQQPLPARDITTILQRVSPDTLYEALALLPGDLDGYRFSETKLAQFMSGRTVTNSERIKAWRTPKQPVKPLPLINGAKIGKEA